MAKAVYHLCDCKKAIREELERKVGDILTWLSAR